MEDEDNEGLSVPEVGVETDEESEVGVWKEVGGDLDLAGVRVAFVGVLTGNLDVRLGVDVGGTFALEEDLEGVFGTRAADDGFVLGGDAEGWIAAATSGMEEGGVSGDKGDGGSST